MEYVEYITKNFSLGRSTILLEMLDVIEDTGVVNHEPLITAMDDSDLDNTSLLGVFESYIEEEFNKVVRLYGIEFTDEATEEFKVVTMMYLQEKPTAQIDDNSIPEETLAILVTDSDIGKERSISYGSAMFSISEVDVGILQYHINRADTSVPTYPEHEEALRKLGKTWIGDLAAKKIIPLGLDVEHYISIYDGPQKGSTETMVREYKAIAFMTGAPEEEITLVLKKVIESLAEDPDSMKLEVLISNNFTKEK